MAQDWRYLAVRLNGDGTSDLLHPDLPLSGVRVRQVLSGPPTLSGFIQPTEPSLMGPDGSILRAWSTAIYAECDGQIRGGGVLAMEPELTDQGLTLEGVGLSAYPNEMPWTAAERQYLDADPAVVIAEVWAHLLSQPGGNTGLSLSVEPTSVRVGSEEEPLSLSWWETHDLSMVLNDMAVASSLDYYESMAWTQDDQVQHRLRYARSIGRRRHDLRFVLGENIEIPPSFSGPEASYASHVIALGAGEGATMLRAERSAPSDRLRRVAVVPNKALTHSRQVAELADQELAARSFPWEVQSVRAADHGNAPVGSFEPGDEIFVDAGSGWSEGLSDWHRIVAIEVSPESPEAIELSLVRV